MKRWTRRALGGAVALAAALAVVGLSRVPYDATVGDLAVIRLSWRIPGERVLECRRLSAEELERLPAHMRREEVCEGRGVPYHLRVSLDGRIVVDETVRASGAREDRPLYVHRELLVPAGAYLVEVSFEREGEESPPEAGHRISGARSNEAGGSTVPGRLALAASVRLAARDVSLITYDSDRRRLAARGRGFIQLAE
jgi:hypothetical protein